MRALAIPKNTTLIAIPIFNLEDAADTVVKTLKFNPINIEIFDALTFDLALRNPSFFKDRINGSRYYRVLLSMYTAYHVRFRRRIPELVILATLDEATTTKTKTTEIVKAISTKDVRARAIINPIESEMFWQIRRASYALSKCQDPTKRPAAFLEDMTVPPECIGY